MDKAGFGLTDLTVHWTTTHQIWVVGHAYLI